MNQLLTILYDVAEMIWYALDAFIPFSGFLIAFFAIAAFSSDKDSIKREFFFGICGFALVCGPLAYFFYPLALEFLFADVSASRFSQFSLGAMIAGFPVGILAAIFFYRSIVPHYDRMTQKMTKRSDLERNSRTDVREISRHLPNSKADYDPSKYFNLKKGVFVGRDENEKPQYVSYDRFKKSHVQVVGTTGAGKGVASGVLLSQAVIADEAVFVIDPKNDEWAPHLLREQCEKSGKPFYLINLREDVKQLDFLAGMKKNELKELLIAGFSLAEKGTDADFYRLNDRRAARVADDVREKADTLAELFALPEIQAFADDAASFISKLEELSLLRAINAKDGLNLADVIRDGGCVYIVGSMRESSIITAQRMLLIRLIQLAEQRDRVAEAPRPICIFLDEFKYHVSRPAMESLGAARDKGVHVILAHQSLDDLRDCPSDLDADSVIGAVVENCGLRLAYRVQNPETAEWLAKMSGTILVDDETRRIERNAALAETVKDDRIVKQSERNLIDTNMLLNLPPRVAIFFGDSLPASVQVCPIPTTKKDLQVFEAECSEEHEASDSEEKRTQSSGQSLASSLIDI